MTNECEIGVVVGRFQVPELHSAHRAFITEVESRHSQIIIFVGVHPFPSAKDNPLDFPTRAAMLRSAFPNAMIMPIHDHSSDEVWSSSLDSLIKGAVPFGRAILYGGRDSFVGHYEGVHPTCELHPETAHSGTDERDAVRRSTLTTANERRGAIYACANRYPEVKPTVDIALVKEEEKGGTPVFSVLLGRKGGESGYRFPGGFVEPKHKCLEEAVLQELREETGIWEEKNSLWYAGSFQVDDWRTTQTESILTSFFFCHYTQGAAVAGDDLAEVKWVNVNDLHSYKKVKTHVPLFEMFDARLSDWREHICG